MHTQHVVDSATTISVVLATATRSLPKEGIAQNCKAVVYKLARCMREGNVFAPS